MDWWWPPGLALGWERARPTSSSTCSARSPAGTTWPRTGQRSRTAIVRRVDAILASATISGSRQRRYRS